MEEDPITAEQIEVLSNILGEDIEGDLLDGFLIVCSRLVDNFGHHRTHELEKVFQTHKKEGRNCLKQSLIGLCHALVSYDNYAASYPVSIIPPKPAFPMLRIVGIERLAKFVYRVLDSNSQIRGSNESIESYIMRTGKLPYAEPPNAPVLRQKPTFVHWCSYLQFNSPEETQDNLQILPEWSNCELRATLSTKEIAEHTYMAYNGDHYDPNDKFLSFYGYFFEPITQDHPTLDGGDVQIKVFGAPTVSLLEKWHRETSQWQVIWPLVDRELLNAT